MPSFTADFVGAIGRLVAYLGGDDGLAAVGAVYFGMVGLEWLGYLIFARGGYRAKEGFNNIAINLINTAFESAISGFAPLVLYVWMYHHWRFIAAPPVYASLLLAFLGHELAYYLDHRLSHRIGLLWAFHQVHHSSSEYNFAVAARGFVLDSNVLLNTLGLPLALLGVPPILWVGMDGLKSVYGIFNHADFIPRLGVLEEFIATPANHRAHHGIQPKYIDKNFSQVTVIFDRLFGTFQREEERAIVGLKEPFESHNPITTELAGLHWLGRRVASADRWQDKVRYFWKPPEWSHLTQNAVMVAGGDTLTPAQSNLRESQRHV